MRLDWNDFGEAALKLAVEVDKDFCPDVIAGVGKSGMIPASIIAKKLGVDEIYSVVASLYGEGKPPVRLYEEPKIGSSSMKSLRGRKVLVVDDFVATGTTMDKVEKIISDLDAEEVKTAVIGLRKSSMHRPDYVSMTFDGCLLFPWDPPPE